MSYQDRPIGEFLDRIASERVTPAGGTALAVVGATGAALVEMACIHTSGTDQAETPSDGLAEARTALSTRRAQLLALGDQDAAVVDELFGGTAPSPDDPALKRAISVPMGIARTSLQVMEIGEYVYETVSAEVAADARAGLFLADAVVQAAAFMVRTNLSLCENSGFVEDIECELATLERDAATYTDL